MGRGKIASAEISGLVGLGVGLSLMGLRTVKGLIIVSGGICLGVLKENAGCVCSRFAQVAENGTVDKYF